MISNSDNFLDDDELAPAEIISESLEQLAEFLGVTCSEIRAFDDPNAHNNAVIASLQLVGFVPNVLSGDYIEAQRCLAETMSALFSALQIPRRQHGAFAAGMLAGITAAKDAEDGEGVLKPTGIEVSRFGQQLHAAGRRHGNNRKRKGK